MLQAEPLADVERLASVPGSVLTALRDRFRAIKLDDALVAKLGQVGEHLDSSMRAPMRAWHARRAPGEGPVAARLFILGDPVGPDELRRALGDPTPLLDAGLIEGTADGRFASSLQLALVGGLVVFGDATGRVARAMGEAVPPLNAVTRALARAVAPVHELGSAHDLGCGAGALALVLAQRVRRVVATDVSARAVAFARFNARLNGVVNVEVRQGDLFVPVAGQTFDRIVSQPPFSARPPGVAAAALAHGGTRGDELALRVLAGASRHLVPGGRAVVLSDWPLFAPTIDEGTLDERVRAAIDAETAGSPGARNVPVDVLVLHSPNKGLDDYCTLHAAAEHPHLDAAFARAACAQRDHLERLGLRGIAPAFVVLEPSSGKPRTGLLAIRHGGDAPITATAIDRILAGHAAALGPAAALQGVRLRIAPGTRFVEQPTPPGVSSVVIVQAAPDRPEFPAVVNAKTALVIQAIDRAGSLPEAARSWAQETYVPIERATALVEIVARDALLCGALEIA